MLPEWLQPKIDYLRAKGFLIHRIASGRIWGEADVWDRFVVSVPMADRTFKVEIVCDARDPMLPPDFILGENILDPHKLFAELAELWDPERDDALVEASYLCRRAVQGRYREKVKTLLVKNEIAQQNWMLTLSHDPEVEVIVEANKEGEELAQISFFLPLCQGSDLKKVCGWTTGDESIKSTLRSLKLVAKFGVDDDASKRTPILKIHPYDQRVRDLLPTLPASIKFSRGDLVTDHRDRVKRKIERILKSVQDRVCVRKSLVERLIEQLGDPCHTDTDNFFTVSFFDHASDLRAAIILHITLNGGYPESKPNVEIIELREPEVIVSRLNCGLIRKTTSSSSDVPRSDATKIAAAIRRICANMVKHVPGKVDPGVKRPLETATAEKNDKKMRRF
mmetsp:Transcript_29757/g.41490  ORF Transcript_29757/g.41490 Transcript_29757/m.41490 type:complete len:393 (+) Transcript_29757:226-1404(+)|eukprot:CAMPEP_0185256516 /NCGR_PEP_ID=MMETSP1359-20130426/5627_1 /TAXON_ID=552665 /ORGANISM="Bigelowiella longifila, Strain CCMP242" /LENGTH=392 /DNA_ID=CAMNT_0027841135 /DNA_START=209 /DNA_END=1387 /DNA_ORIENTATION=-